MLIEHGADVNAKDYRKFTPLHIAATFGKIALFIKKTLKLNKAESLAVAYAVFLQTNIATQLAIILLIAG